MRTAPIVNNEDERWLVINSLLATSRRCAAIARKRKDAPSWILYQLDKQAEDARAIAERLEKELRR